MSKTAIKTKNCPICQKEGEVLNIPVEDWQSYVNGEGYIQNLFPYLTSGQREKLITGICEECFDSMWED